MFLKITKHTPESKDFHLVYELDDTFTDLQISQLSQFCKIVTEHEKFTDIIMKVTNKL